MMTITKDELSTRIKNNMNKYEVKARLLDTLIKLGLCDDSLYWSY